MKTDFMPILANEKIFEEKYRLPTSELFTAPENTADIPGEDIRATCDTIVTFFDTFNTKVELVGVDVGPRVARYIIRPGKETKIKRILDLMPDLQLDICAKGIRAVAPLEGTKNVGIEIDRTKGREVRYREAVESSEFSLSKSLTEVCLGVDVTGKATVADLDRMHGLIIGGCTGSGKSVLVDNIIANILCRANPHEFKLALIDPKMVEFGRYKSLPHLYAPVANNTEDTMNILESLSEEAKRRLAILESAEKSFKEYNASAEEKLPHIAVIADEIADFMISSSKNRFIKAITDLVNSGSQCGIYVIIATQRADRSIITKELKDAFCSRACLRVPSYNDSKCVLEYLGAERLLNFGDMLFRGTPDIQTPKRIQVPFISTEEINALIEYVKAETARCSSLGNEGADASDASDLASALEDTKLSDMLRLENENYNNDYAIAMAEKFNFVDASILPFLVEAMDIAADRGLISTAIIQRRMSIGFGKAARIIDYMEDMGFVSEKDRAKPRRTLIDAKGWKSIAGIVKSKYHLETPKKLDDASTELIDIPKLNELDDTDTSSDTEIGDLYNEMPDTASISAALNEKIATLDKDGFMDFMKAIEVAVTAGQISTALLQRRLSIGFGKAARFIDYMEEIKIVTPKEGTKPRGVLITREDLNFILSSLWE